MTELNQYPEQVREALKSVSESVMARYDVLAILASGTIIRGDADARSDLDVHVLHRGDFRERLQEFHERIPCEIFVNPPSRIPGYFKEDADDRRPMTAHMFATGILLFDPEGVAAKLQEEARALLVHLPAPSQDVMARYGAATMLEDALDLAERDPESAALVLGEAVWQLAQCRMAAEPGWLPRPKDLLTRLKQVDSECGRLMVRATMGSTFAERLEAARRLCQRVTGAEGFFEWASDRQVV